MLSICGMACCEECSRKEACGGCRKVDGHPFGGTCVAAECIKREGLEAFSRMKAGLIAEFNALDVPGLAITELHLLNGFFVNLEYRLANEQSVKLLNDNDVYLGNQVEIPGSDRCYGLAADGEHLLVCEYGCGGADPEIVVYKRR